MADKKQSLGELFKTGLEMAGADNTDIRQADEAINPVRAESVRQIINSRIPTAIQSDLNYALADEAHSGGLPGVMPEGSDMSWLGAVAQTHLYTSVGVEGKGRNELKDMVIGVSAPMGRMARRMSRRGNAYENGGEAGGNG